MSNFLKNGVWTEKYRPQTVSDLILPRAINNFAQQIVNSPEPFGHLIFSGSPGLGKTTLAHAIANDKKMSVMYVNASLERNIDTLRGKFLNFMGTGSFDGSRKLLIADEAENLNPISTQPAMKVPLEEFADNCSVIFCTNAPNMIIDAIKSRAKEIDFSIPKNEQKEIAGRYFERIKEILKQENVDYDEDILIKLMRKYFPDFRKILNEVYSFSKSGKLNSSLGIQECEFVPEGTIFKHIKEGNYLEVRKWIINVANSSPEFVIDFLYKNKKFVSKESFGAFILLLNQYQFQNHVVNDKVLNMQALMVDLHKNCEFLDVE